MLEHWLKSVSPEKITAYQSGATHNVGKKIHFWQNDETTNFEKISLAIIGIGEGVEDIRRAFYALSDTFSGLSVADFGNVRKEDISFVAPLINELIQSGIVPILIGSNTLGTLAQFNAYKMKKNAVTVAVVDEKIDLPNAETTDKTQWENLFSDVKLFSGSVVGLQMHYTNQSAIEFMDNKNFEIVRLGKAKSNPEESEPVIRDADMVCIHLSALKYSDAPAQKNLSPSGFTIEEACQLARYAGMSDKLTSFGIYGFQPENNMDLTAESIALMLWYFVEGFYNRKGDFPISAAFNQLTQYLVDVKTMQHRVSFWRSNKSGRWWMEIPVKSKKKLERHRLISCSYNDYLLACNDDLSERLMTAYRRFV
jgi:formiminoglutamase